MKDVVIVQHRLLHYRIDFFTLLKEQLLQKNICLHLVHGGASKTEAKRKDEASLSWAHKIKNTFLRVNGVDLVWQPLPSEVNQCDLLILMQENRILSNYPKILRRKFSGKKVAYWGHGKNLQSKKPTGLKERWKKKWLTSVDWWFAYTGSTVDYLSEQSFPLNKITCLNNAVNVNSFKKDLLTITSDQLTKIKSKYGIEEHSYVGVFCGSLYAEKRLDLLLEAIDIIKSKITNFYLVVIGDGPDADFLHKAALTRSWLILVGIKKGAEKALYYRLASIMLNPGLVGLHILDSFCAGIPMITTVDALHSPEYDYLESGVNGLVTIGTATVYANSIIDLLTDENKLNAMKISAYKDSNKY